ncbi:MAG TPA: hypothetical protein DIW64_07375 [Cellvibrio sp.]|nr:hypothetical protein [Cellvibrio sp.]
MTQFQHAPQLKTPFAQNKCINPLIRHLPAHSLPTKTGTKKTHTHFACSTGVQNQTKGGDKGFFAAPLKCTSDIGTVFE